MLQKPLHKPKTSIKLLIITSLTGVVLGVFAQLLRQTPGVLMSLGASTTPWIMSGFLLAVLVSRGELTQRNAFLIATGNIAVYLLAWLVSYHLLFVIRESVSFVAGWHQVAPWLLVAVPVSPILGIIAAISHKRGLIGDVCLSIPIAFSITEAIEYIKEDWLVGAAVAIPIIVLGSLMIYMVKKERQVRTIVVLTALVTLGALGVALYPVVWFLLLGRY